MAPPAANGRLRMYMPHSEKKGVGQQLSNDGDYVVYVFGSPLQVRPMDCFVNWPHSSVVLSETTNGVRTSEVE